MSAKIQRLQLRPQHFANCPELQTPLNSALVAMQDDISAAVDGVVLLRLQTQAVDVYVNSNAPGTQPWPLRLSNLAKAPLGAVILRVENLTNNGVAGVPTTAVGITTQKVDGGQVLIDFITGLTVGSRYRFHFGVYDGA